MYMYLCSSMYNYMHQTSWIYLFSASSGHGMPRLYKKHLLNNERIYENVTTRIIQDKK